MRLQYGGRKRVKTSGIYFGYRKGFLLSFELQTIHIDASLAMLAFQTSKKNTLNRCFHIRDILVSRHLYVTYCEKKKTKI